MKHNTCILLFAICTLLFSCAKEEPIPVQTFHVENESVSTSYHTADILIDMEENYPDGTYYVLYSTSSQMNDFQRAKLVSNGTKLSGTLTGLTEGTTYYYKLNVVGDFNTITLEQQYTFTTREYSEPLVRTGEIQSVTYTTANVSVALDEWGSDVLPEWGLCYATTVSPTVTDSKIVCPNGQETMITLNSLTDNTTYYVRAFATNSRGTTYGQELTFTTLAYSVPTVETVECRFVTKNGAILYGNVTSGGGLEVTQRGFCYATTPSPTISNQTILSGIAGEGGYSCALTDLNSSTTYYVRAFAVNSKGTSYGNQLTFTTTNN